MISNTSGLRDSSVGMTAAKAGTSGTSSTGNKSQTMRQIGMDVFLKLLLAELKNQDPLKPLDNHELLQQISQIREVESNMQLTETLEAVFLGQMLNTATGLLGQNVEGLSDSGQKVRGKVEEVSMVDGRAKLRIDGHLVDLRNVQSVQSRR